MTDKIPDWCPAHIWEEAKNIYFPHAGETRERAARALLSAYRRGVEDSAKVADDYAGSGMVVGGSTGSARQTKRDIAAAIRRLGEAE